MTTVSAIVSRALRMLGANQLGDTAGPEEAAAGLAAFQQGIITLFPGTHLTDVLISANYTAGENERITDTSGSAVITKPTTMTDATSGELRAPLNGAIIEIASASTPQRWIYVTELAGWQALHSLTTASAQPLGPAHDEGLAAMMAIRLAPELQIANVPQWVVALAQEGRRRVRQQFRQPYIATTDPLLLSIFQRHGDII